MAELMTPDQVRELANDLSETGRNQRPKRWLRLVQESGKARNEVEFRLVKGAKLVIDGGAPESATDFWYDLYDAWEHLNDSLSWVDNHKDEWFEAQVKDIMDAVEIADPDEDWKEK